MWCVNNFLILLLSFLFRLSRKFRLELVENLLHVSVGRGIYQRLSLERA